MTSTTAQLAKIQESNAELAAASNELTNVVSGKMAAIDADRNKLKADLEQYLAETAAHLPVTPNLIADTKRFEKLCGGLTNTPTDIFTAHGDLWSVFLHEGTTANGTLEIVTNDKFLSRGIAASGALLRATTANHFGSDFRVALFDVEITSDRTSGNPGELFVLNQGSPTYTGWGKGEFRTQAVCFINVLEHQGDIRFLPHDNMPAIVTADGADLNDGWIYKYAARDGWGGEHQPRFQGIGRMKVALALPYIGTGDSGGNFVWAGSVGRYTHEDRISPEFGY